MVQMDITHAKKQQTRISKFKKMSITFQHKDQELLRLADRPHTFIKQNSYRRTQSIWRQPNQPEDARVKT